MQYRFAPQGVTPEDAIQLIIQGWAVLPNLKVEGPPQLALPGQPQSVGGRVDLWFLPEPMMPQGLVIAALVHMARNGFDVVTLNELATRFFGQSVQALELMMTQAQQKWEPPEDGVEAPAGNGVTDD